MIYETLLTGYLTLAAFTASTGSFDTSREIKAKFVAEADHPVLVIRVPRDIRRYTLIIKQPDGCGGFSFFGLSHEGPNPDWVSGMDTRERNPECSSRGLPQAGIELTEFLQAEGRPQTYRTIE